MTIASLRGIRDWNARAAIRRHGFAVLEDAAPFVAAAFAWLDE